MGQVLCLEHRKQWQEKGDQMTYRKLLQRREDGEGNCLIALSLCI